MDDIEHGPCCDVCGVLYVTEYEGPCQERRPSGIVCGGHVSWEAAFDRLAANHRGAVSSVLAQADSLMEALERDLNDVGPFGNGYRRALADVREQLRLRFGGR